jgi:hypothetical protein
MPWKQCSVMIYSLWWPFPMPQQELSQTISCPQWVSLGSFACSYKISQGFVSRIRHPYRVNSPAR